MKTERDDKNQTLRATESIFEYLTYDLDRLGYHGLVHILDGARSYCADHLLTLGEVIVPYPPPDTSARKEAKSSTRKKTKRTGRGKTTGPEKSREH